MLRKLFDKCLALASPGFSRELDNRNERRAATSSQWFAPQEAAVAWALAKIIVPAGDGSPGIENISPDQSALASLDKMVAEDSQRQQLYSHGLLAFDHWALTEHKRGFADLSTEDQINLFRAVQERYDNRVAESSSIAKLRRGFESLIYARKGIFHAERLYPAIRNDCLQIFYTSSVSWTWLQYDGPPMEKGYPSLTRPR
jgi:Gluconate 2-dehydrogenase subunit 3